MEELAKDSKGAAIGVPESAAILAGGLGTRLRPLTCRLPKPLVPVANVPILGYTLALLRRYGVRRVVLLLLYRAEAIRKTMDQLDHGDLEIEYVAAVEDYGTAGAVRGALSALGEEFFVLAGDVLTDVDLRQVSAFHRTHAAIGTIVTVRVDNPTAYGLVLTTSDKRVKGFLEKPTWGQVITNAINGGVYLMTREALQSFPADVALSFEHDVFPSLIEHGAPLFAYSHHGYWRDIGSLEDYHQANRDVLDGLFPPPNSQVRMIQSSPEVKLDPASHIVGRCVFGPGAQVGAGAEVERSVIGPGCRIEEGARVVDCVLWNDVSVGPGSELVSCVVASGSRIGRRVFAADKVVIGEATRIGNNVRIHEGVKIWPGKAVDDGAIVTSSLVGPERWTKEIFEGARVTGQVNVDLTPEFGARLGAAFGSVLGQGSYVIASRDVSPPARMMNRALICGLMSAGIHVEDLRVTPIPIVRYALRTGRESAGFYVRKSPFDPDLLDILFFDKDGRDLSIGRAKAVERMFYREDFARADANSVGRLDFPVRVTEGYIEDFLKHLDLEVLRNSKLKIVIDYSFGAASYALPQILGELRCDAISLNAYADPAHLTRTGEEFRRALVQLSSIVTSVGADVGFLIDAGAEKIFVIDEKGRFIDSGRLLVLVTHLVLQQMEVRKIAVPVTVTSQIEEMAEARGAEVIRTPVDSRTIIEACLTGGARFAGDGQGGFIFSDFLFSFDGMFALAKLLELMARGNVRFGYLDRIVPRKPFVELQVPCPRPRKGDLMRRLLEETAPLRRDLTDGILLVLDGARVLLLPDHSRPIFHVRAEAEDPLQAADLARQYRDKIRSWLRE